MAIMTSKELIKRMYELYNQPNRYGSGGNQWSTWQKDGWWFVDCVCSIKAILWGGRFIDENRNKNHAGCKYASNDIPDTTPDGFLNLGKVSTDFTNIIPGEVVIIKGMSHIGLYVGDGKVLEVTAAWTNGNPGCQLSNCDKQGRRTKDGKQVYSWTHHVALNAIDYTGEPAPTPTPTYKRKIGDVVKIKGVYVSSTSDKELKPAITRGTITRIVDARNPYLLDNGRIGWINDGCIIEETPSENVKSVVNCYWLNLRTTPAYGNNIYTAVKAGTKVGYLGMENGWAKIKYNNKVLYCGSNYLG